MKFIDNRGKEYNYFISSVFSSLSNNINDFINKKFKGVKEAEELIEDNNEHSWDYIEDNESSIDDCDRDNIFIPGVTPKVTRSRKHAVVIDTENNIISLLDENNNIIHKTIIDPRIEGCAVKNIIDMVYETMDDFTDDEEDEKTNTEPPTTEELLNDLQKFIEDDKLIRENEEYYFDKNMNDNLDESSDE